MLSINKNVFLKILNSPSKICEARDNIIIYRSKQRPLTYFLLRILYKKKSFFLKLLKILEINESRLNSSVRSFEIWYWRFQGISIKRVIFSRSPGAKLHQYRLNCRHIYVDLMAIETMKSFICFDSIDYLTLPHQSICCNLIYQTKAIMIHGRLHGGGLFTPAPPQFFLYMGFFFATFVIFMGGILLHVGAFLLLFLLMGNPFFYGGDFFVLMGGLLWA